MLCSPLETVQKLCARVCVKKPSSQFDFLFTAVMPKGLGFFDYIKAAFSAKPAGMPLSPNWIFVAAAGMLGVLLNPGFLLLGAGLELGYLLTLGNNERFRRVVNSRELASEQVSVQAMLSGLVAKLSPDARERFGRLQSRCKSVLALYQAQLSLDTEVVTRHSESLNRFVWIFLQLLLTRETMQTTFRESRNAPRFQSLLEDEIADLEQRLKRGTASDELRRSLESKRDILKQRLDIYAEAGNKLHYIDAELERIEQQIELLREQAVVSRDSSAISVKIDTVSSSLGETSEWIKEQQNLFGLMQEGSSSAPQILGQRSSAYEG
ncbi:MAG: hypothetical protein IAF08_00800 [Rhizobacter sp.]|nr:hypothetical protein [Chlorobiales bacterium]